MHELILFNLFRAIIICWSNFIWTFEEAEFLEASKFFNEIAKTQDRFVGQNPVFGKFLNFCISPDYRQWDCDKHDDIRIKFLLMKVQKKDDKTTMLPPRSDGLTLIPKDED